MPLISPSSWRKDLLPEAVELLGVIEAPARERAQADVQRIVDDFTRIFGEAAELPTISDARQDLTTWASGAEKLAGSFREGINSLIVGSATNDPAGNQAHREKDQQELNALKSEILAIAFQLDQLALTLRERAARWSKNTGQLTSYQMVHGNPKEPFALACVRVFAFHRPDKVHAGKKGDLYQFCELIFEHTTGHEPKGDELLSPLRWGVEKYREPSRQP